MIRLLLVLLVGTAAILYFPDSRAMVMEVTEPVLNRVARWNLEEEMRQVSRDVAGYEASTGSLPDRRRWLEWLDYRYASAELRTDPWGSTYELKVWTDSVGVLSYGPDRLRETSDDVVVAMPRRPVAGR